MLIYTAYHDNKTGKIILDPKDKNIKLTTIRLQQMETALKQKNLKSKRCKPVIQTYPPRLFI